MAKGFFQFDRCLICHEVINPPIGWNSIFSIEKGHFLCEECEGKLETIKGETCHICGRSFTPSEEQFRQDELCLDCVRWEDDSQWSGLLLKNSSLYVYNDFLKEVIALFKYRGDYAIAKAFSQPMTEKINTLQADLYIPVPLSDERLYERGFNQAEALILGAGQKPCHLLTRIHSEKQSKKTRSERIHLPQVFHLHTDRNLMGKNVVLVDDIYTTGSTLRHAAKLLKDAGALTIQSLTLARG
ncbi:ComF family protein [Neobacillus sp. PS3-34]|uniref:ComF family protein n=1 Tax=Neobacillus sp. PS3-34 TaxID=3070678 RepID=UPI0027E0133E|nr:ComF family protein [Neobacillus sp. PS3-34]WML46880.1 ComF family protein [Neobacillus sp. PS3-34]